MKSHDGINFTDDDSALLTNLREVQDFKRQLREVTALRSKARTAFDANRLDREYGRRYNALDREYNDLIARLM